MGEDEPKPTGPSREAAIAVIRGASLLALGFAVALVIDGERSTPAFCATGSGCDAVRHSAYSHVGGVPVSALGLSAFALLFVVTFLGPTGRRIAAYASIFAGVVALALLGIQAFVVHAFCKLCLVVDVSSLVAAGAAVALLRAKHDGARVAAPLAWLAIALGAIFTPILGSDLAPDSVAPPEVRAFFVPGKINVVEFSDFECPFCRALHPSLVKSLANVGAPVNFVRLSIPLAMHPHARPASRAYLCAERQGKGEAMADALFSVEPLTNESGDDAARALGLDVDAFKECEKDPRTDARIEHDNQIVRKTDFKGLPTVWIGDERVLGARPEQVDAALAHAKAGTSGDHTSAWLRLGGMLCLCIALFVFAQRRPAGA